MKFEKSDIYPLPFQIIPNRHLLPTIGAVYFVISDLDILLYIGASKNIRRRWKQHDNSADIDRPKLATIYWMEIQDAARRLEIEKELIIKFKPPLNSIPAERFNKQIVEECAPKIKIPGILSVREVAERFEASKRRVMGWCERGLLPNAKKVPTGLGFDHWQIPETDLENFVVPEGRGRPKKLKPAAED